MPIRSDRAHSRRIPNSIAFNFLLCLAIGRRFFLPRSNICSREDSVKFLNRKKEGKETRRNFNASSMEDSRIPVTELENFEIVVERMRER